MSALTGLTLINNYAGAANDPARVQLLLDVIPNPDVPPASSTGLRFLDEMSPAAAAQLRLELAALKAAVS